MILNGFNFGGGGGGGGIALVSSAEGSVTTSGGGTGGASTPPFSTVGANLIVVCVTDYAATSPTFSDNQGNTYIGLTPVSASGFARNRIFYCLNPITNASHVITIAAGSNFGAMVAMAFSGVTGPSFDTWAGGSSGAVTSFQMPGITPASSGLVIASLSRSSIGPEPASIDDGFTVVGYTYDGFINWGIAAAYKIQGATLADPTFSWSTSAPVEASIASFV